MKSLLSGFLVYAEREPQKKALVMEKDKETISVSYGELKTMAEVIASYLLEKGLKPRDKVAISLERGIDLIASILGVMWAGGAYVPVNPNQPLKRRKMIYEQADIKYCITFAGSLATEYEDCCNLLVADALSHKAELQIEAYQAEGTESAYVIFTSGSTGVPKGVEIAHASAMNTLEDVTERFGVTKQDMALAVSSIDFDLSVFDIFGMLTVGGSILLLEEKNQKEPTEWIAQIKKYGVTVWNSVPALFEMLMYSLESKEELESMKLVLLSGDWVKTSIYMDIQKHCKNARLVALGGATEASVWSNFYEVKEIKKEWNAIPYGVPLKNQKFRIVADGKDVDSGETGELWIGGEGLAKGYVGNKEQTEKSFIMDNGERWYRTGDLGYFDEEGIMIFAGRMDQQVKVNGLRIELGEVENKLSEIEGIKTATALVKKSQSGASLVAVLEPAPLSQGKGNADIKENTLQARSMCEDSPRNAVVKFIQTLTAKDFGIFEEDIPENLKGAWKLWENYAEKMPRVKEWPQDKWSIIFKERLSKYARIFKGEELPQTILEDSELAPANLFLQSEESEELTQKIIDSVQLFVEERKSAGKKLNIGFIYGRGNVYSKLFRSLEKYKDFVCVYYFESSEGLLKDAKKKNADINLNIHYRKIKYPYIEQNLGESMDGLVIINGLHTFTYVQRGLKFLQMLLNKDGVLFGLESTEITSMGLVTAAVLENGFIDYEKDRKQKGSPMLSAKEWCDNFRKAGYASISGEEFSDSKYFVFEVSGKTAKIPTEKEVDNYTRENLPEYMIPQRIYYTVEWPLTANGKVDRKTILEWFEQKESQVGTMPQTEVEKCVADIWKQLLGLEDVYIEQSFFEIGGDSLLLSRMIAEIRKYYGVSLAMKEVFENSSLVYIASMIEAQLGNLEFEEGEL